MARLQPLFLSAPVLLLLVLLASLGRCEEHVGMDAERWCDGVNPCVHIVSPAVGARYQAPVAQLPVEIRVPEYVTNVNQVRVFVNDTVIASVSHHHHHQHRHIQGVLQDLQPGYYRIRVEVEQTGNRHLLQEETDFIVDCDSFTSAQHSQLELTSITTTQPGVAIVDFLVHAMEASGLQRSFGGDTFDIALTGPALVHAAGTDLGNGTYHFVAHVHDSGVYSVEATLLYSFYAGYLTNPNASLVPEAITYTYTEPRRYLGHSVPIPAHLAQINIQVKHNPPSFPQEYCGMDDVDVSGRWIEREVFEPHRSQCMRNSKHAIEEACSKEWRPHRCKMRVFDRDEIGQCLKGKRIAWVGDSVMANLNRYFASMINKNDRDNTKMYMNGELQDHILDPEGAAIVSHWLNVKGLWKLQEWTSEIASEVLRVDEDDPLHVLVINMGLHDAGWFTMPMFERVLLRVMQVLHSLEISHLVMVNAVAPHMDLTGYPAHHSLPRVEQANRVIAEVASRMNITLVMDAFAMTRGVKVMMRDSIHPLDPVLDTIIQAIMARICVQSDDGGGDWKLG